jgi:formylglycine-generating enzyme required for sulfatase activity
MVGDVAYDPSVAENLSRMLKETLDAYRGNQRHGHKLEELLRARLEHRGIGPEPLLVEAVLTLGEWQLLPDVLAVEIARFESRVASSPSRMATLGDRLADVFHRVPSAQRGAFAQAMRNLCASEHQGSAGVALLAVEALARESQLVDLVRKTLSEELTLRRAEGSAQDAAELASGIGASMACADGCGTLALVLHDVAPDRPARDLVDAVLDWAVEDAALRGLATVDAKAARRVAQELTAEKAQPAVAPRREALARLRRALPPLSQRDAADGILRASMSCAWAAVLLQIDAPTDALRHCAAHLLSTLVSLDAVQGVESALDCVGRMLPAVRSGPGVVLLRAAADCYWLLWRQDAEITRAQGSRATLQASLPAGYAATVRGWLAELPSPPARSPGEEPDPWTKEGLALAASEVLRTEGTGGSSATYWSRQRVCGRFDIWFSSERLMGDRDVNVGVRCAGSEAQGVVLGDPDFERVALRRDADIIYQQSAGPSGETTTTEIELATGDRRTDVPLPARRSVVLLDEAFGWTEGSRAGRPSADCRFRFADVPAGMRSEDRSDGNGRSAPDTAAAQGVVVSGTSGGPSTTATADAAGGEPSPASPGREPSGEHTAGAYLMALAAPRPQAQPPKRLAGAAAEVMTALRECGIDFVWIPPGRYAVGFEGPFAPRLGSAVVAGQTPRSEWQEPTGFYLSAEPVSVASIQALLRTDCGCLAAARSVLTPDELGYWQDTFVPQLCGGSYQGAVRTPRDEPEREPMLELPFESARRLCEALGASLPSWQRWEAAARGPDGRLYPWGNDGWSDAELDLSAVRYETSWADPQSDMGLGRDEGTSSGYFHRVNSFKAHATAVSPMGLRKLVRAGAEWNTTQGELASTDVDLRTHLVRSLADCGDQVSVAHGPSEGREWKAITESNHRAFSGCCCASFGPPARFPVAAFRLALTPGAPIATSPIVDPPTDPDPSLLALLGCPEQELCAHLGPPEEVEHSSDNTSGKVSHKERWSWLEQGIRAASKWRDSEDHGPLLVESITLLADTRRDPVATTKSAGYVRPIDAAGLRMGMTEAEVRSLHGAAQPVLAGVVADARYEEGRLVSLELKAPPPPPPARKRRAPRKTVGRKPAPTEANPPKAKPPHPKPPKAKPARTKPGSSSQ